MGDNPSPDAVRQSDDGGSVVTFPRERSPAPPNNLPFKLSSFVGRESQMAEVRRLLAANRLVTLTGPGGSGKTRLALAVAAELSGTFGAGVWLVELAPLSDPEDVPQALASALRVREVPGRPLTETLADDVGSNEMLLVMDNCEHLVEACASLVSVLLGRCPNLRVLVTSRESLGVEGETLFVVPPLSLPDPHRLPTADDLSGYEAARLFLERARAVRPHFEITEQNAMTVAQVCHRLDGMPLAIELAAARTKVLSVEQISSRLDNAFRLLSGRGRPAMAHHGTLRATMDWSYELLSERERVLFRRLSVFAGGFTLEATEGVCAGGSIGEGEVLDLLSSFVDKSLVAFEEREGEARYRLLETVRQYALERLEENGEVGLLEERHAEYYLALAKEAEPELREQEAWLGRLGREHANFRAALSWALDRQDEHSGERAELGLGLADALAQGRFWNAYGPSEGRRWLEKGLAETTMSPVAVRAKALREAGWIATHQGDYEQAVAFLKESRSLFEELGDRPGTATSLIYLGHLALHGGTMSA